MKLFKTVLIRNELQTFTIYIKANVNVDIWPVTIKYKLQLKSKAEFLTTYVHTCILSNSFLFVKMAFVPEIRGIIRDPVGVTNQIDYFSFMWKKGNYFQCSWNSLLWNYIKCFTHEVSDTSLQ